MESKNMMSENDKSSLNTIKNNLGKLDLNSIKTGNLIKKPLILSIKKNISAANIKNEIDEKFLNEINKINDITVDQSKIENDNEKKVKKKEKIKFSLYDLEKHELLGSGVSGQVFFVKHKLTNKSFALKIIPLKNDESMKILIENEVKILHSCKCENIVKCYATYFDSGAINILLEFMDKGTLADILKKVKKIPENILGYISSQILIGLEYLRVEKRIVHRDIKPSNILVNSKGQVKISDFGVSSIVLDSMKGKETLVGTYNYMSPERIRMNSYSFVSDVWSIGMSILESAIGIYPFFYNTEVRANDFWTLHKVIDELNLPELSKDEFSDDFRDFLKKCLDKDPSKRYNSKQLLEHPFILKYSNIGDNSELIKWLQSI